MADPEFEERFSKIQKLISDFHAKFNEKNTMDTHNTNAVKEIPFKIQQVSNTLNAFLAHCLEGECNNDQLQTIVDSNMVDADKTDMLKLLHDLSPLMEWNPNMNSRFGKLTATMVCYPFSPHSQHRNNSTGVDGPVEQEQEQEQATE
jgi:hypothetical protein